MPVEIFFKPLTLFVWIGVGIMTFGGLLAAWYRRRVRLEQPEAAMEDTPEAVPEHAPQSVA
jgi:cytochrome c biogenesis factor